MTKHDTSQTDTDQLFQIAEQLAKDFSLLPEVEGNTQQVKGLLSESLIAKECERLQSLNVDAYIDAVVTPSEQKKRPSAKTLVEAVAHKIITETEDGPLYAAEVEMRFPSGLRRIGFLCQDRQQNSGAWMPHHHLAASQIARNFAKHATPIVTFIDTPGAEASEEANANNQAHSISRLIAEMANTGVPSLGIVVGAGYSGGAIPLATCNMLLSVRDGIFNTIQPQGLASIARKYQLSWQQCAKYVGVSPYELFEKGCIDGVIDFSPADNGDTLINLINAITSGIESIEKRSAKFVLENPYILDHYSRSVKRFLAPSRKLSALEKHSTLLLATSPTEHHNAFGLTYRYLRYLSLRKRLRTTTIENYGRLAEQNIPEGEFKFRLEKETDRKFKNWLQSPDKLIYEDNLAKLWKNYSVKKEEQHTERGSFASLIFGAPEDNFQKAKQELCFHLGLFLFNRWKGDAEYNFQAFIRHLETNDSSDFLIRENDVLDSQGLNKLFRQPNTTFIQKLAEKFDHKVGEVIAENPDDQEVSKQICVEINHLIGGELFDQELLASLTLSESTQRILNSDCSSYEKNRKVIEDALSSVLRISIKNTTLELADVTILDVVSSNEMREDFIGICRNMLLFGALYDEAMKNLVTVAQEANESRSLSYESVHNLLMSSLKGVSQHYQLQAEQGFQDWLNFFVNSNQRITFLQTVETWKRLAFPRVSDTLFVIITFFFEKLLPDYFIAENNGSSYSGKINPNSIGRRKDFWNRLTIAYHDLLIQDVLDDVKRQKLTSVNAFIERFTTEFHELDSTLMSADPVSFPGFRSSLEQALSNKITPCGVVTGIATLKSNEGERKVGMLVSNLAFQAGAFDMASAQKLCSLLVECAKRQLPVVCFVSSGGMQTKEGAASLFSMPIVNDRITRFVRDNDLPFVIFGFGDCTGGVQASFVTHPMVQTYYFSGTNMPFAGQIVVPSYLPTTATLSNYLSESPDAMTSLVKHPFAEDIDERLRKVDPQLPIPTRTVDEVLDRVLAGYVTAYKTTANDSKRQDKIIRPVKRLLIHARGCTAVKLIRIAQKNQIPVVLVQSDPDMQSVPVDMLGNNDRVVCIGGNTPDESYLNAHSVLRVARHEGADSLHPGIGFLSESAQFAQLCGNHNLNFIGPDVSSMETMGNKSNAISTAMGANVPVVPGSHGILTSSTNAAEIAEKIGYPVLLKAVHGGGGKGIQVVEKPSDIHELFHRISGEARSAFGNGDVYLEKYVTSLRHIEAQILRDSHGNCKVLGLRDCSVQRNNQKLFEESASTMLPKHLEDSVYEYALLLSNAVGYIGAGTVEFIYDLDANAIYFMEMNTRLQVEHPVTEQVSGIDIVSEQFNIAEGGNIKGLEAGSNGYSIEVRVNAEKAVFQQKKLEFIPSPGIISKATWPESNHIDLITIAKTGKQVSPYYDSLIAQVICHGSDREDCISKLIAYFSEVKIEGICSNIPLLMQVMQDSVFRDGEYDTTYLPQLLARIDADALIKEIEATSNRDTTAFSKKDILVADTGEYKVLSPSTGIFYSTPGPSEPVFVKVGDKVKLDQTLCLLEAMKMFSPLSLKSLNQKMGQLYDKDQTYRVTRIHNSDGQQVNEGDLLFLIKPDK
jgi:acetyl/propionyl-CoA carboxylase alpha subunit